MQDEKRLTLAETALDMQNQMRNVGNMGTKLLNKALVTNHMN